MELPSIKLGPKPKRWDLVAILLLILAGATAAANWIAAAGSSPGAALSGTATFLFVAAHLTMASLGLFALGKTAKEGTIWGNLAAVGAMLAGVSGTLLAAAIWVAA